MTELIWEGKYKDGKKVTPVRIALPFQTIETINESAQQRQKTLDFFSAGNNNTEWRNRLIWGDKKYVLPSLLPEFAGKVNLIYIDPPFNVGNDFSFTATIADNPDADEDEIAKFVKEPSIIEQKAYRDTWGVSAEEKRSGKTSLDKYLQWFYETILLLRDLLSDDGSIYVHLDWHVGHYAKAVLDEIFGYENFRNDIIWKRSTAHSDSSTYGNVHDVIYFYTKGPKWKWNQQYSPYTDEYIETQFKYRDKDGRRFRSGDLTASGLSGGGYIYEWNGIRREWRCPISTMKDYKQQNKLTYTGKGLVRIKYYLDEMPGLPTQSIWDDVNKIHHLAHERVNYSTQKPEALLERIIKASSNEGDLILDCFCGSGTTAAVAEKNNRKWITCDLGRFAIHTARKRFLEIDNVKPFIVENLGKYERQQWMNAEFENPQDRLKQERAYKLLSSNSTIQGPWMDIHGYMGARRERWYM